MTIKIEILDRIEDFITTIKILTTKEISNLIIRSFGRYLLFKHSRMIQKSKTLQQFLKHFFQILFQC